MKVGGGGGGGDDFSIDYDAPAGDDIKDVHK